MDNAIKLVNSFVSGLSSIFVGLLGLGVVAGFCLLYTSDAADERIV